MYFCGQPPAFWHRQFTATCEVVRAFLHHKLACMGGRGSIWGELVRSAPLLAPHISSDRGDKFSALCPAPSCLPRATVLP